MAGGGLPRGHEVTFGLCESMRAVLYVGAAVRAATPEQRERLQVELAPILDGPFAAGAPIEIVTDAVGDIMGDEWEPDAETQAQIDALHHE